MSNNSHQQPPPLSYSVNWKSGVGFLLHLPIVIVLPPLCMYLTENWVAKGGKEKKILGLVTVKAITIYWLGGLLENYFIYCIYSFFLLIFHAAVGYYSPPPFSLPLGILLRPDARCIAAVTSTLVSIVSVTIMYAESTTGGLLGWLGRPALPLGLYTHTLEHQSQSAYLTL